MAIVDHDQNATRVLLLTPTARDAEVTRNLLHTAGLASTVCANLHELTGEIQRGAGAALITEEVFKDDHIALLIHVLDHQPPWSTIPVILLISANSQSPAFAQVIQSLRNVMLLERPASMRSVVSAVQAAVRGRERQYQIRDQLDEIRQRDEERKQLLESERTARAEAERANRVKDEFLAVLSHELRTPLNTISMCVQFLSGPSCSQEDLDMMLRGITNAVQTQTQLISDLLDVSRIVSGKLALDKQLLNIVQVIEAAIDTVAAPAGDKAIEIVRRFPSEPVPVLGDATRLQQVTWNLLANAIKFTPRGGRIELDVAVRDSNIEFSVKDSGCGIEPEVLPHIFERFRQSDSSTTRKHGGLGLGLSIVKQIVELHDGTVTAWSDGVDKGSTFRLVLPAASGALEAAEPTGGELSGLRVMVVDDDPEGCILLKRLLESSNAEVMCVHSGDEALEQLDSFKAEVLLSDIGMPGMDGHTLIREIRARGKSPAQLPAAALTAFAGPDDRRRSLQAGFQSHITKPINGSKLISVVASLSGRARLEGRNNNIGKKVI